MNYQQHDAFYLVITCTPLFLFVKSISLLLTKYIIDLHNLTNTYSIFNPDNADVSTYTAFNYYASYYASNYSTYLSSKSDLFAMSAILIFGFAY